MGVRWDVGSITLANIRPAGRAMRAVRLSRLTVGWREGSRMISCSVTLRRSVGAG